MLHTGCELINHMIHDVIKRNDPRERGIARANSEGLASRVGAIASVTVSSANGDAYRVCFLLRCVNIEHSPSNVLLRMRFAGACAIRSYGEESRKLKVGKFRSEKSSSRNKELEFARVQRWEILATVAPCNESNVGPGNNKLSARIRHVDDKG